MFCLHIGWVIFHSNLTTTICFWNDFTIHMFLKWLLGIKLPHWHNSYRSLHDSPRGSGLANPTVAGGKCTLSTAIRAWNLKIMRETRIMRLYGDCKGQYKRSLQGGPLPVITGYNTYKWGYNPTYLFIRPFTGVRTPFIAGKGPPCMNQSV